MLQATHWQAGMPGGREQTRARSSSSCLPSATGLQILCAKLTHVLVAKVLKSSMAASVILQCLCTCCRKLLQCRMYCLMFKLSSVSDD